MKQINFKLAQDTGQKNAPFFANVVAGMADDIAAMLPGLIFFGKLVCDL
jgi:hypothetical protein